jgi:uncharacterized protein (UPF0335 family)
MTSIDLDYPPQECRAYVDLYERCERERRELAKEVKALRADRDRLAVRFTEVERLLPRCAGRWVKGSGGHRVYDRSCSELGTWDAGLWFVCDEHRNKNGGDNDAWRWWDEREKLEAERDSLAARVTELTKERDAARANALDVDGWRASIDEAEADRLRTAVRRLLLYVDLHEQANPGWNGNRFDDRSFAENALATKQGESE